jgi:N-acetylmuramoyl-L-alanine amidase
MKVNRDHSSPNFEHTEITPEFVVLHYTACDLPNTLKIFASPQSKVCAHFVLSEDGTIYDLGDFLNGPIWRGAHAGESRWALGTSSLADFNGFALGIELVNRNGNLFAYSEEQYTALTILLQRLIARFPTLNDPQRIVGHEHIAGFRGKIDPGARFDWPRFYQSLFPALVEPPERPAACAEVQIRAWFPDLDMSSSTSDYWSDLSSQLEGHAKHERQRRSMMVNPERQEAELWLDQQRVDLLPISTAKSGLGCELGSFRTPTGRLRVAHKLGAGHPRGAIFRQRAWAGEVWPQTTTASADDDLVLTRILWVEGLEEHNRNTIERYIYLHGTNQEALIGTPASHGCIRFSNADIERVYDFLAVGSEILVRGQ